MAIRYNFDPSNWMLSTEFSGDVSLAQFANYARELSNFPFSDVRIIHFADATKLRSTDITPDQFMTHAEQILARLAAGSDTAAVILLAPTELSRGFARMFQAAGGDEFPIEVFNGANRAMRRVNEIVKLPPEKRPALTPISPS